MGYVMENVVLLCDQPMYYKWIESSLNKEGYTVNVTSNLDDLSNDILTCNNPPKIILNTLINSRFHDELMLIKKTMEQKFNKKLVLAFYNDNQTHLNSETKSKYDIFEESKSRLNHVEFIDNLISISNKTLNSSDVFSSASHMLQDERKLERIFIKLTSINQLLNDFGKKYVNDVSESLKETIKDIDRYMVSKKLDNKYKLEGKFFDYREHIREYFASLGFFNYEIKLQPNKASMLIDDKYGIAILDDILMACVSSSVNSKNISIFEKFSSEGLEIEFKFHCFEVNIIKTRIRFAKKLLRLHGGDVKIKYDIAGSSITLKIPEYRIQNL